MSERAAAELTSGRRGRRAAAAVLLGVLALGGVSACQNEAGSAAFVGNTRITQDYVNNAVNTISPDKLSAQHFTQTQARQLFLQYATFNDLASRYAKEKGYSTPAPDTTEVANIASALGISADKIDSNEFIRVIAQGDAWANLLLSKQPKVAATEADYQQIYEDLLHSGAIKPSTSFESIKSGLAQALPDAGTANALRNDLDKAADRYGITVNPRYAGPCDVTKPAGTTCGGLTFPLSGISTQSGNIPVAFVNMGGTGTPVVLDVPTQAPATGQ